MALKTERFYYTAKNFTTGLTDVKATIRRNGVQVAGPTHGGGGSDDRPTLTEVNATDQPGVYVLTLAPATITGFGGAGLYEFYINSDTAGSNAPAITKTWILATDAADLSTELAAMDAKVDIIDSNLDSVKTTVEESNGYLENGTYGLDALKSLIDAVQSSVSSIQNNTRFTASLPVQALIPGSGSNTYRVPAGLFDTDGNPEDPDSNQIAVTIKNAAGTSRKSYLAGYVDEGTPIYMTRDDVGQYRIDFSISSSAPDEELIFEFSYAEGSVSFVQRRTTLVVQEVQASGFALETTAQSILTDTADMQPRVADIQTKINDATYGLAALKALIDTIDGVVDSNNSILSNGTYGLSALKTILDGLSTQASLDAAIVDLDEIKGTGFATGTDSLKEISDRTYLGGKAV